MAAWRSFAQLFDGSRRLLAASLALAVAQSALLVPIGLIVRHLFDHALPTGDRRELVVLGCLVLVLYLGSAALALATRYAVLRATKAAITELRGRLVDRLLRSPSSYFDRHDAGELHATVVQDSERLDITSNALVGILLPAAVISAALSVGLAVLNLPLFALLAAVLPVLIFVSRALGRRVRERTRVWQHAFDVFSAQTLVALRGMSATKAHAVEDAALARARGEHRELEVAGRTMAWMQTAYTLVNGAVAAAAGVIVLLAGGLAVIGERMTVGDLLAFYALVALLRTQVNAMLQAAPQVIAGRQSLERLRRILDHPEHEPYGGTRPIAFAGSVALEGVTFAYGDELEPLLRDVSLHVERGELVALVGPNGAGKSTLVGILLGLLRPSAGRALADGVPLEEVDVRMLRRRVGVVEQDAYLLPGTIAENVSYLTPGVTEADVREAMRAAGGDGFAASLPYGYATRVGDDGALLSGGERQRIALARALVRRPALLVLDEPTTSLDADAVADLVASLRELPGRPAILMVTHDREVSAAADRVYELSEGRARERAPAARTVGHP